MLQQQLSASCAVGTLVGQEKLEERFLIRCSGLIFLSSTPSPGSDSGKGKVEADGQAEIPLMLPRETRTKKNRNSFLSVAAQDR